jgi:hypothetical protein
MSKKAESENGSVFRDKLMNGTQEKDVKSNQYG